MNSWSRLKQVIDRSGLTINAFALSIGLKRAENLYQIKKGKNAVSKDLASLIVTRYPDISGAWLITGEGAMFTGEKESDPCPYPGKGIPFYGSISVGEDSSTLQDLKPLYYLGIPSLLNCDFAITHLGDSMVPDIPSGAIVTLKKLDISALLPGEIYLVVTNDYNTIKRIRTCPNNDQFLRLVPVNSGMYDETVIEKSMIRHLFLIKGVISLKIC